jgi:hypothetical protein
MFVKDAFAARGFKIRLKMPITSYRTGTGITVNEVLLAPTILIILHSGTFFPRISAGTSSLVSTLK